jgi:hypothetical protein
LVCAQSTPETLKLTFTTIDVPGARVTSVNGINIAGDMVGHYGQSTSGASHGFLLSNGVFTYFDYPGQSVTVPSGINGSGLIVGYAGSLREQGFLYDGSTFTSIRDGSDSATVCLGIDDTGDVVGGAGTPGVTKGFELHAGQFKNISPPPGGWIYVYATGINNLRRNCRMDIQCQYQWVLLQARQVPDHCFSRRGPDRGSSHQRLRHRCRLVPLG